MKIQHTYAQQNMAYWANRAPGYSDVNQEELATSQHQVWSRLLTRRIMAHYPGRRPQDLKVLDIGTGPGFFSILLAEQGFDVTGVDYTPPMLEEARKNAGPLAQRIRFLEMDAQRLLFPDETFHVVLSRNLTWNLPQPETAYAQWVRVLKPGGLLLNFDANWYRYLYDPAARVLHQRDREQVALTNAADDTAGTDVDAMEAIARQAPLSALNRPEWDLQVLGRLGMDAYADCQIWRQVWTRTEWINNASTPMFLISGQKTAKEGLPCRPFALKRSAARG